VGTVFAGRRLFSAPVQASTFEALATAEQWVADIERLGTRCERKPTALAFHWRGLANERVVEIHSRILEKWTTLAAQQALGWHDFDGGIEFRARGWDKGEAVKAIVAESGPQAACAYLGDDLDDERAFKAMPDSGLSVLVRGNFVRPWPISGFNRQEVANFSSAGSRPRAVVVPRRRHRLTAGSFR
jgi:trehalose-phosphatase